MRTLFSKEWGQSWVVNNDISQLVYNKYPRDTVEIPNAPPGEHRWDPDVQDWKPASAQPKSMSRSQFSSFCALHGYDDAIEQVKIQLKASDRKEYANLTGLLDQRTFTLKHVLLLVERFKDFIPPEVDGMTIDVSEEAIRERWNR